MKNIITVLMLCFCMQLLGQSNPTLKKYYQLTDEATKDFHNSKYKSALKKYEDAFKLYPYQFFPAKDYMLAGCANIELHQFKKGTAYLKKAISNGGYSIKEIKDQEGLEEVLAMNLEDATIYFKSKFWKRLVKKEKQLTRKFFKAIDSNLYAKIKSMYNKDQYIRKTTDGWTREIELVDSLNWVEIKNIVKEKGWPGQQKIGSRGAFYSDLLLNHSFGADYMSFIMWLDPIVKQAVFEGNLRPFMYAFWIDRRQKMDGDLQLYGTYVSPNRPLKEQVKLEGLDKRRNDLMLPRLEN